MTEDSQKAAYLDVLVLYSHSMVPGGFEVMS